MKYAYYHMQHVRRVREADRSRATRGARVSGPQSSDKAVLQIRVFETPVLLHLRLFKTGPNRVNSTSRRRAGNSPEGFRRSSIPLLPNIHTTGRSSTTMQCTPNMNASHYHLKSYLYPPTFCPQHR